ncbi:MAG TPA: glycosyltransferase family 4 protein, partial [Geminicoccaceae bacterium]|nr:glycosyltransferase family 4 protein [Geminicoccaceae bacterium]
MTEGAGGPTVLQVLPALGGGGVERGTVDLAAFLAREGWNPVVASGGGPLEARLAEVGASHVALPLHSKNPAVIARNAGRLRRLIRERGVRLVHARSRAPAWSAWLAARACGVPFVTTFHGVYGGENAGRLKRLYNGVMARGERVIAISEYVAEHVRARYGVAPGRLRVIHRGVDVAAFDPAAVGGERVAALARRWGVEPRTKVVMLPGRVTRIKGHLLLLRALARLPRRDYVCLFVGGFEAGASYVREIEAAIEAGGLGGIARLVGPCDDMPAALRLAHVVAAPSVGPEAFGRVSVEAQAMGRPVIVTDVGGLGETLMPAATGWLVPPGDVDELARALQLALDMGDDVRARLAI